MELSIVSTLYNSEQYVPELIRKLIDIVDEIGIPKSDYEIILVDDGSPDNSLKVAIQEKKKYPDVNIKIIELSRNFGHHNAIMCGLKYSKGEYVYLMDADMEVKIESIKLFYEEIKKHTADVIYGIAEERTGNFVKRKLGGLFWSLFNFFSDTKIPPNIANERIMNRKYINALLDIQEKNFFIGGIWYWLGFQQIPVNVQKVNTQNYSSYTTLKRFKLAGEAITSFSHKPLYYLFLIGIFVIILSLILSTIIIIKKIMYPHSILIGYPSIIISILFSTGLIMMGIGTLGIYLGKIFKEVKNRPLYIVKNIHE